MRKSHKLATLELEIPETSNQGPETVSTNPRMLEKSCRVIFYPKVIVSKVLIYGMSYLFNSCFPVPTLCSRATNHINTSSAPKR